VLSREQNFWGRTKRKKKSFKIYQFPEHKYGKHTKLAKVSKYSHVNMGIREAYEIGYDK
jgi:hypothetical protein